MHRRSAIARPVAIVFALLLARAGFSQPVSSHATSNSPPGARWSAAVGYETLSLRDIARTSRPVTASPIAWEGGGPAFRGRIAWDADRRVHRIDFGGSFSGGFGYRSPLGSDATSDVDRARSLEARYEYRRYPFRNVVLRGLDFGIGVEALGARTTFTRHVAPETEIREWRMTAGVGGSLVAAVRRRRGIGGEIVWTNGLVIGRRGDRWTSGVEASGGGGGWLTTLSAQADVRLRGASVLYVNYTDSGEGFLSSHRSYALSRRRIAMGVTYGR